MKTFTLTNDFHGTQINVRSSANDAAEAWFLIQAAALDHRATASDKAKYRRVKNTLCGMSDCECGIVR